MKDEEKKLIENLFYRLKNAELNSSDRDDGANNLIQDLVKKQPYSSYYMVQTILIQETAIKKLSLKIEELENKLSTIDIKNKKPSFLSSFFKKEPNSLEKSNSIWEKNSNIPRSCNHMPTSTSTIGPITNNSSSGFLKNALQTATGVAGGMILGNMLMNIFNHSKPEEEIFDTINNEHVISNLDHDGSYDYNDNSLVDYNDQNDFVDSENLSNFDEYENTNDINDISDINDDNFI
ncbi:Putative uncharacterized protein Yba2 [Buchnera aphidicola (Protaphis terricola)]|uniref:DUF2076 domain-containing protein n=1 Tax=Buchnera aphidicola TaxID=9 RepID=UPI003464D735